MGEVWRAADEVLGRAVAVKLLLGDHADESATARFRLEAQTAARLSHPHLVAVFDFGAWEDRFYLVMELIEGRSLGAILTAEERLGAEQVARIAGQAAAGLAAAHRQGIVHRDIKPGNLMLDAEGSVKIGDFGIAQFVDDPSAALTTTGQIVGTSLYLAPERALGRTAGSASDMYSLGCVIYQLLLGEPPFRSDTATATLYQHVDTAPVPLRQRGVDLPPAFDSYLLGLLAKQPEDRPGAQDVAEWFQSDAWRGQPEPLPMYAPAPHPAAGVPHRAAPAPGRPHTPAGAPPYGAAAAPGPAEQGSGPATYRMPQSGGHRRRQPDRSAPALSTGAREAIRRRPRVASAVAGTVAFIAAVYLGMTLFSQDPDDSGTPDPGTSATSEPQSQDASGAPLPPAQDSQDSQDSQQDSQDSQDDQDD
ncbi:protein kinase [Streptomyces sp. NPDC056347]|uniref:serine/threonine-protein kinase n=1 Tax=Streptomyces sp. NPDC056347 TaxID=3345790 RepID=UPI0035D546EA